MAGHNKWAQIKRQKGKTDAEKSKAFSKFSRLIAVEAKKVNGDRNSFALKAIIERAQAINMPKDSIDRAVKKATESATAMEANLYEAYGPGGCAMLIDTLTDNKNKAVQEVKAILARHNYELAGMGSASWAFEKSPEGGWKANTTVELSDDDVHKLDALVTELEANDEVQAVYTNVE